MNKRFLNTLEKYNMISDGDAVLVAVSGGADSMALLNLFLSIRDKYGLKLIAAHIEHGIRGQESLDDAEFVRQYCEKNNIDFNLLSIDAVNEARLAGMSVEEYSRNKRYDFFNTISCDKIATAHNLSDNVETVLFRLCRGSGLKGMCGIPPVRGKIIRPLIEINAQDIRNYCNENHIKFRIDSTNLANDYSRNSIRNEIIPLLKGINSGYESSIAAFIKSCNEDYSLIQGIVDEKYEASIDNNRLLVKRLKSYDIAVTKRIILKYFSSFNIFLDSIHLKEILNLLNKSGKIQIKGNEFAVSDSKFLRYAHLNEKKKDVDIIKEILNIDEFNCKTVDFYCDYDKINGNIFFRQRQSGDCIHPANRNCTKSLKKLFNELSVPIERRNDNIIICDDDGIIGIVGYCVDERVKTDKSTKKVLSIKLPLED